MVRKKKSGGPHVNAPPTERKILAHTCPAREYKRNLVGGPAELHGVPFFVRRGPLVV